MRAGKHRATGSNITKPMPEPQSPLSRKPSATDSTSAPAISSDEKIQTFEPSLTSIMDSMPVNGDWSSILTDECNPYLIRNPMDLDDQSMKQRQYSGPFSEKDFTQNSNDLYMDPILIPHDIFAAKSFSDSSNSRPMTASTLLSDSTQHSLPTLDAKNSCHCDQKVTQQLLALTKIPEVPAAFDTALNQNKQVIAFCRSILDDQTHHHHHDISFVFTLTALITKVIKVYDTIYNPYHNRNSSPTLHSQLQEPFFKAEPPMFNDIDVTTIDSVPSLDFSNSSSCINPSTTANTHQNSPFTSTTSLSGLFSPAHPVRLTLGSYRLDEKDEEKLKWDIFKIELSKVSALVKAFEQKFSDGQPMDGESKYEAKAYEDMVYYLQKRLRVSLESPREEAGQVRGAGVIPVSFA